METREALFKLDSTLGSVWRLDTNGFQRILVRDLISQKAFTERKKDQVLKHLRAIEIPEINLRQESISNVVAFLQKQIREMDHTISRDSDDFLRLKYIGYGGTASDVTFKAEKISALEALKIITEVAGFRYRIEDDCIVVEPWSLGGGPIEGHIYEVSPLLRDRLTGTSISNVFSKLGFDLTAWTGLKYSPELDMLVACTTYSEHQRFQELLFSTGLARQESGRFRLVSSLERGQHILFLLDDKTGETWLYRCMVTPDGRNRESFDFIHTDW